MSSYNNPTKLFKSIFGIIFIGAAVLTFIWRVLVSIKDFILNVFLNLQWITIISLLMFGSILWFNYGFAVVENVEYIWRCELEPMYVKYFRPFFSAMVTWWEKVCWWNLVGQLQRLLSGKLVWGTLMECPNGFRFWNFITDVVYSFIYLFEMYIGWFFAGDPVDSVLPLYPWIRSITKLIYDVGQMIACLCGDIRILVSLFSRVLTSNNLSCAIHQLLNAELSILQVIVRFVLDIIYLFFEMIFVNPGDTEYVIMVLSGEIPGFNLPTMVPTTERISAAAYYIGQFLNDILQIIICTGISEIDAEGDVSLVEGLYETCMLSNTTRTDLFCWTGPLVGLYFRAERAMYALLLHLPRILHEFAYLPPGNRYLTDDWIVKQVYDTIRFPPISYNFTSSVNVLTVIPGSNTSVIVPLAPNLYGNYTNVTDINCEYANTSMFVIPCSNCSEVEQYDLEECICKMSNDIDRVVVDLIDFKIFDGIFCCLGGKLLRIAVALFKFLQGLAVHILVIDRFSDWITDYNNWNEPIDEIIGPYNEIGGILSCCARILKGFDPRLECFCVIIVNLIKPLGEIFRILIFCVVGMLNIVFNTDRIKFFDMACTTKSTCFNMEERVYKYLRRDRPNTIGVTGPNYLDTYFPLNTMIEPAWIDCFCQLISFGFLNQFQDNPLPHLPDFCCGLDFGFRIMVSIVEFIVGLLFTVFETVGSFFDGSSPFNFVFFGYLACDTVESCAPTAKILSDILDFLKCDCAFIKSIDDIINPYREDIKCLCKFTEALAYIAYYSFKTLALAGQLIVALLNCGELGFPSTPECKSMILDRLNAMFEQSQFVLDSMGDLVGTIGCVLGLLFRYDCIGGRYYSPSDYPICENGSSYGVCAMGDRLASFFKATFFVIIVIPKFVKDTIRSFALVAFNFPFTGFTGFSDLLRQFLLALGDVFFGTADPVNPTTGWLQAACLLLNCMLGPDTSDCMSEIGPALDSNASGACIGDILCVLGNALRDIWAAAVYFITSFIGIIEALLAGNTDLLVQRIIDFIKAFFDIIKILLGSLDKVIEVLKGIIVGIADYLLPGFGVLIKFALDIAFGVAQALLRVIGAVLSLFGKRTLDFMISIQKRRSNTQKDNDFDEFIYHTFDVSDIESQDDLLSYTFAKHFKFHIFDKVNNNIQGFLNQSTFIYDENYILKEFLKNKTLHSSVLGSNFNNNTYNEKRNIENGLYDNLTLDDLMNLEFNIKTKTMADTMAPSDCQTAMSQFTNIRSINDMQISEVFIWKLCYTAYALPIAFNTLYNNTLNSNMGKRNSQNVNQYSFEYTSYASPLSNIYIPPDMFYNPLTFLSVSSDYLYIYKEALNWLTQYNTLSSAQGQNIVDIRTMPDWFWAYEQQLQAELNTTYSYSPKRSKNPNLYVNDPNESWQRISHDLLFIELPGDQISVPVINGRYPMYIKNVTFTDHMIKKGYNSKHALSFINSLNSYEIQHMEDRALDLYSRLDAMEKRFRESQVNSTDMFGNYKSDYGNFTKYFDNIWSSPYGSNNDTRQHSSFGKTWDRLFQMNERKYKEYSSNYERVNSKRNSEENANNYKDPNYATGPSLFNFLDNLKEFGSFLHTKYYNSISYVHCILYYNDPSCGGGLNHKSSGFMKYFIDQDEVTRKRNIIEKMEGPLLSKEEFMQLNMIDYISELKLNDFDTSSDDLKQMYTKKFKQTLFNFNFYKYFTKVVPTSIVSIYRRLIGDTSMNEILFKDYVNRHYGKYFKFDDLDSNTIIDPYKRYLINDENIVLENNILTKNILYEQYKTQRIRKNNIYSIDYGVYDDKNKMSLPKSSIQEKYGHVLNENSLFTHRMNMLKNATISLANGIYYKVAHKNIMEKFFEKYVNPYVKKYSDTIQIKGRTPTFYKLFALFERIYYMLEEDTPYINLNQVNEKISKRNYLNNFLPESNDATIKTKKMERFFNDIKKRSIFEILYDKDSKYRNFMMYGEPGELFDKNDDVIKRSHQPPLIPICLPGNAELTCTYCKNCPIEECSNCTGCRNCTSYVGGTTDCERCATCSIGGPNCKQGCKDCQPCSYDAVCLDCVIIEEFVASIYDGYKFCRALQNGDLSVIRKAPPNTSLVNIIYVNTSSPNVYKDPISNFIFNTILLKITNVDIGATAVDFTDNTNLDPFDGSVGLLFFLRRWLHLPFIRECNRDIDTMCTFGRGLEEGLKLAFLVTFSLGIVSYILFPSLGGIISNFILTMGWLYFFAVLTMSFSWFYNPYCLISPQSIIYSLLFPMFPILPMFPRCAAEQILALLDKYIVPCSTFLQENFFANLSPYGSECLTCPTKQILYACDGLGFTTQFTTVGYYIQRYWPNGNDYLNQTCLVQGGCFLGLGGTEWAPLRPFFDVKFNITYIASNFTLPNSTINITLYNVTNETSTLDTCAISYIFSPIISLVFVLMLLYFFFPLLVIIFEELLILISKILEIPPFSFLIVWPLDLFFDLYFRYAGKSKIHRVESMVKYNIQKMREYVKKYKYKKKKNKRSKSKQLFKKSNGKIKKYTGLSGNINYVNDSIYNMFGGKSMYKRKNMDDYDSIHFWEESKKDK